MKTTPYVFPLFLVLGSCNSDSSAPTSTKDAGHGDAQSPAPDGGADCVKLQTDLFVALEDGAKCKATDGAMDCSGKAVVKDRCGCDTVLSDAYTHVTEAQQASEAYRTQCGTPGCAGIQCPSTGMGGAVCKNINDGRGPVCISTQ
jgi:hypothetical protein